MARTLMVHDFRRLLLRDPELPAVLLPARWPGQQARDLCRELYQRLLPASEGYLDQHLQLATGEVPAATAVLAQRFF
jgi:phenylacetic acid degradation operon negative regulatory protein